MIFIILAIIVVAILLLIAVDQVSVFSPYSGLLKALILIVAALVIAQKAGLF